MFTFDNPVKAAGKVARHGTGGNMAIGPVERTEGGELKVEVTIDLPSEVTPPNFSLSGLMATGGGGRQWAGGMVNNMQSTATDARPTSEKEHLGVSILDSQGTKLSLKRVRDESVSQGGDGMKMKMTLIANLAKDAPDPSRLVFRTYPSSVEVSFAFKDVVLQ